MPGTMLIVFDFDDTLVFSRDDRAPRLLAALGKFGCSPDESRLIAAWGRPFRELAVTCAPDVESNFDEFLIFYAEELKASPHLICPGVVEALEALAGRARLFVHSASESLLVRTDLESSGIIAKFDFVCGSDWQDQPKPALQSLQDLLKPFRSASSRQLVPVFYVGDSQSDAAIAAAAGASFIGAGFTANARRDLCGLGGGFPVVSSMLEILPVIGMRSLG